MSEENWKLEKDLCRCCLSEGSFKNLAQPYLYQGEDEIYSDMLVESLDVNLTPVSGPLCSHTYTICDECILRLRDACIFKRQVLTSEKRFRDLYSRDVIQLHSSDLGVKEEAPDSDNEGSVKMEMDDDDFRLNYKDDEDGDNKSDIDLDLQAAKKAKPKKPKAKEKPKPKKRAGRPRKLKAEADGEADAETEAEAVPKEKKGVSVAASDYTLVGDGGGNKYSCNVCGTLYKSLTWMTRHIQGGHGAQTKRQSDRIKEEVVKNEIDNQGQTSQDKIMCGVCHKGIKNQKNMAKHMSTHGPFKCPECKVQFSSAKELRQHKRKTHSHVCHVCNMKTTCQNRMISHLRTHGTYKCADCPDSFPRKVELAAHKRLAHRTKTVDTFRGISYTIVADGDKENFICHQCGTISPSLSSLKYHIKRHVDSSNGNRIRTLKKFICDYCGKETSLKWKMVKHIQVHHTPVKCPECFAMCPRLFELYSHRRSYHPNTLPTCGICGFQSSKKYLLIIHQRKVHMGEKNVSCPHCDATFFNRRMLNNHLVRHNPVKKFECRFCKKKFPRKNTRNMHEKIHLGQKNKICAICDARFVQKASLNYHMKKYHPEAV